MATLSLPDLELNYHRWGRGFPLVLVHGWPEWSAIWRRLMPLLTGVFTRVKLQITVGAGYLVHLEWPDQSTEHIIRFSNPLTTEAQL